MQRILLVIAICALVGAALVNSEDPRGKPNGDHRPGGPGGDRPNSSQEEANSDESVEDVQRNPCEGLLIGILQHPTSCYKYISCYKEVATEETCDVDTIFDVEEITCVPGNQRTCRKKGDEVPIPSDMCRGIILGSMLHPEDCGKYVSCLLFRARERSCPRGFVFSDQHFVCLPGDVNSCTVTPRPPTTTSAPVEILPIPSDFCRKNNVAFGSIPHPQVCTRFVRCTLWIASERECGRLQVFSERLSMCVPGNTSTCRPILGRDAQ